ncbi:estrogen receptor beta-like [Salmo trutta]|uniref:estrogen receptor beta-like n=1 Tax=Salmo trutta TaxID=8032 RepID=UPI00113264D6|nr:estrogen receptor beta-like [Salmo trutta]
MDFSLTGSSELCNRHQQQQPQLQPNVSPSMACFPGSGTDTSPLLQVQKVGSIKAPGLLPTIYSPLSGMESSSHCIPSSHTGSSHDYSSLAFYNHSTLGYSRPTISDSPSPCPPLSLPLFCPPHDHGQHNMPSLIQHCPQPLVYSNPNHHAPFVEPKPHNLNLTPSSPLLHPTKLPGKKLCAICNDHASGYHYSVCSCEGCKAFFKRSIRGHNDYICPRTNQCTIDKNLRKRCKSCRLRKCYEVGMKKCGMRPKRYSYRGARHRRVPHGQASPGGLVGVGARAQRNLEGGSLPRLELHHSSLTPEQLISCIMNVEPPEIYLMEDVKRPFTDSSMMMSLTKLANKELFLMNSWAKKIPGFVELSLTDQVHLLESCWLEVLMLGLMWRSVDHPGKLIFSADLKLNREEGNCVEGIMIIFDMLLAATTRFRELNLQKEEYVCLKAMILLNSNICSTSPEIAEDLESRGKLQLLLDSMTDALVWAISKQGLSFQLQSTRLAHLLMLLSDIRHISGKGMKHVSDMKNKNIVQVSDLLLEMFTNTT